jgi:transcriptional regulator with XRE-family HTH domain
MAVTNVELLKLGLRIRAFRKVLGRNQKDFSKQCGLDRSYFGGVERGERNLSFFILCQICAGLNCDIAAVTEGIPHQSRSEVARIRATLYRIKTGIGRRTPVRLCAGAFHSCFRSSLRCKSLRELRPRARVRSNICLEEFPLHLAMAGRWC